MPGIGEKPSLVLEDIVLKIAAEAPGRAVSFEALVRDVKEVIKPFGGTSLGNLPEILKEELRSLMALRLVTVATDPSSPSVISSITTTSLGRLMATGITIPGPSKTES